MDAPTTNNNKTYNIKEIPQIEQQKYRKVPFTNSNSEEINEEIDSRLCFKKPIPKIEQGSLIECIFNLSIFSLGVGLLTLQRKVHYISLFLTPLLIIIGGVVNYWTLTILSDASRKYRLTKYEDAVTLLFNQNLSYFFSFVMCLNQFGIIIELQIIVYKFLGAVVNQFFSYGYKDMENFASRSFWGKKKIKIIVCYLITYIVLFPLCLIKTISKMRYSSLIGVSCLFLMILILLIQFPSFYYHNIHQRKNDINFLDLKYGFDKNMEFFQSISTIIYAFECHVGLFPVISCLQKPTKIRVQKVLRNAVLIDAVSCMIIALSGYLSQPFNTPELIVERNTIFKHDFLMITGLIFFICTLVTKIGANYNGFRSTILNVFRYDINNYPNFINFIITFLTLFVTTFIAAYFKKSIADYMDLSATFCSIIVVIIMPGMIYIKSNDYPIYHAKNMFMLIFMLVVSSIGLCTIVCTLKKLFPINL
jgi:amino acid permease